MSGLLVFLVAAMFVFLFVAATFVLDIAMATESDT